MKAWLARGLFLWVDDIDTTQPGELWRTSRPGRAHARLYGLPIPVRVGYWLCVVCAG